MSKNKLHSIQINRTLWKLIVWSPIILGVIIFSISSTLMSHLSPSGLLMMGLTASGILIGFGFGLVLARIFKIRGIDNEMSQM